MSSGRTLLQLRERLGLSPAPAEISEFRRVRLSRELERLAGREKESKRLIDLVRDVRKLNAPTILKKAEQRGIEFFVHFTRLENLPSILVHGLLPRGECLKRLDPRAWRVTDSGRGDRLEEATCLSVSVFNSKMYYSKLGEEGGDWVQLRFYAPAILLQPTLFVARNAAKGGGLGLNEVTFKWFASEDAFDSLFQGERRRGLLGLSPEVTTDPQAEVLVLEEIPAGYLRSVASAAPLPSEFLSLAHEIFPEVHFEHGTAAAKNAFHRHPADLTFQQLADRVRHAMSDSGRNVDSDQSTDS